MQRKDWHLGRLHVIRRETAFPKYGLLLWKPTTLDVWVHRTLWTFRWVRL